MVGGSWRGWSLRDLWFAAVCSLQSSPGMLSNADSVQLSQLKLSAFNHP